MRGCGSSTSIRMVTRTLCFRTNGVTPCISLTQWRQAGRHAWWQPNGWVLKTRGFRRFPCEVAPRVRGMTRWRKPSGCPASRRGSTSATLWRITGCDAFRNSRRKGLRQLFPMKGPKTSGTTTPERSFPIFISDKPGWTPGWCGRRHQFDGQTPMNQSTWCFSVP